MQIATPPYPLKRKSCSADSSNDVYDSVLRQIKKIKFPLYIKVKALNGTVIEMDIDSNDSVGILKDVIWEREGIPKQQQKLIFNGKQINDDSQAVNSFGVTDGSVIYLVIALPHKQGYSGISSEHRNEKV